MRWPWALAVSSRSARICMTMAVEDSTKPMAAMNAAGADSPASRPTPVSSAPQASTWATPRPKISPRSFHSREGCISSPMMNRNITTPSSATCRMDLGSEADAERADRQAGRQIPQHRPQPQPLEQRHGDHRRAQQHDDVDELIAFGGHGHEASPGSGSPQSGI